MTVLSEALKDRAPEVRIRAVESLRLAGTVSAVPIIEKAFGDKEASVRLHAALMLKKIGHRSGVPVLGRALLADRPTASVIKLMQAMHSTITPMPDKIYEYIGLCGACS